MNKEEDLKIYFDQTKKKYYIKININGKEKIYYLKEKPTKAQLKRLQKTFYKEKTEKKEKGQRGNNGDKQLKAPQQDTNQMIQLALLQVLTQLQQQNPQNQSSFVESISKKKADKLRQEAENIKNNPVIPQEEKDKKLQENADKQARQIKVQNEPDNYIIKNKNTGKILKPNQFKEDEGNITDFTIVTKAPEQQTQQKINQKNQQLIQQQLSKNDDDGYKTDINEGVPESVLQQIKKIDEQVQQQQQQQQQSIPTNLSSQPSSLQQEQQESMQLLLEDQQKSLKKGLITKMINSNENDKQKILQTMTKFVDDYLKDKAKFDENTFEVKYLGKTPDDIKERIKAFNSEQGHKILFYDEEKDQYQIYFNPEPFREKSLWVQNKEARMSNVLTKQPQQKQPETSEDEESIRSQLSGKNKQKALEQKEETELQKQEKENDIKKQQKLQQIKDEQKKLKELKDDLRLKTHTRDGGIRTKGVDKDGIKKLNEQIQLKEKELEQLKQKPQKKVQQKEINIKDLEQEEEQQVSKPENKEQEKEQQISQLENEYQQLKKKNDELDINIKDLRQGKKTKSNKEQLAQIEQEREVIFGQIINILQQITKITNKFYDIDYKEMSQTDWEITYGDYAQGNSNNNQEKSIPWTIDKLMSFMQNSFPEYHVQYIDDDIQDIENEENTNQIIIFMKPFYQNQEDILHYTVLVKQYDTMKKRINLYYFDPVGIQNNDIYRNSKEQINNFIEEIQEQVYKIKVNTNRNISQDYFDERKDKQIEGNSDIPFDNSLCGSYIYMFCYKLIVLFQDYKEATDFEDLSQEEKEKFIRINPFTYQF